MDTLRTPYSESSTSGVAGGNGVAGRGAIEALGFEIGQRTNADPLVSDADKFIKSSGGIKNPRLFLEMAAPFRAEWALSNFQCCRKRPCKRRAVFVSKVCLSENREKSRLVGFACRSGSSDNV
jgi:hypothetical protein